VKKTRVFDTTETTSLKKWPWCLYGLGTMVLVIVGVYFWKSLGISGIKDRNVIDKAQVVDASRAVISVKTRELLRLSAVPLAWAVQLLLCRRITIRLMPT